MSGFDDLKDKVVDKLVDSIDDAGVQVYVKTDLGGEIKVYDSDDPSVEKKSGSTFIKYGIKVKNRNGKELMSYGEYPKTNYIKMLAVVGVVGTGLFIALSGIKSLFV